jgi:hypothetical protein
LPSARESSLNTPYFKSNPKHRRSEPSMIQFRHQLKTKRRFRRFADLFHDLSLIRNFVSLKHNETNPAAVYTLHNLPLLKSELKINPYSRQQVKPDSRLFAEIAERFQSSVLNDFMPGTRLALYQALLI